MSLNDLVSDTLRVLPRLQEGQHTVEVVTSEKQFIPEERQHPGGRERQVLPGDPGNEQDQAGGRYQNDRGAQIRLQHDQAEDDAHHDDVGKVSMDETLRAV